MYDIELTSYPLTISPGGLIACDNALLVNTLWRLILFSGGLTDTPQSHDRCFSLAISGELDGGMLRHR